MNDLSVRRGATLPIQIKLDDEDALSAELIVKKLINDTVPAISKTSAFTNGISNLTLSATETDIEVGDYIYQITVTYNNDVIEKYPELNCDTDSIGEDSFPTLTIGESLDS